MKILHTSDLHLGKKLLEESLYKDQKYILEEIIKKVDEKGVDVVIISGDIYDKIIPNAEAIKLFDEFITDLAEKKVKVLIVSGNHDSNERLAFGSDIFNRFNIHIATSYDGQIDKVSVEDVDFYLLPFLKPFHVKRLMYKNEYESINDSNDMMKWILSKENLNKEKTNILVAHQFVMRGGELPEQCDSESISLHNVGTIDAIDVNLLDDFDYVALGHLHKHQIVKRKTVRYSGTPLKYSFSEADHKKGVVIIDTEDIENIEFEELDPYRKMRVIEGKFEDIMSLKPCDDIIKVDLLDENTIISPMETLKQRFKNAIALEFKNRYKSTKVRKIKEEIEDVTPYELFSQFFKEQTEREMRDEEDKCIKSIIKSLEGE